MQAEDDQMPLKPTRAGFVRGLPETMPIEEVIERAREIGLPLNPSDVHSARYYMRQEALAKLSSRPASVPQLVQASPVVRAKPEEVKSAPAPTNILGLRSTTNGKARPDASSTATASASASSKGRRSQAQARPAAPPAKQQRLLKPPTLPPLKPNKGLEEQLRQIAMRIGTERARRIIEQLEDIEV